MECRAHLFTQLYTCSCTITKGSWLHFPSLQLILDSSRESVKQASTPLSSHAPVSSLSHPSVSASPRHPSRSAGAAGLPVYQVMLHSARPSLIQHLHHLVYILARTRMHLALPVSSMLLLLYSHWLAVLAVKSGPPRRCCTRRTWSAWERTANHSTLSSPQVLARRLRATGAHYYCLVQ